MNPRTGATPATSTPPGQSAAEVRVSRTPTRQTLHILHGDTASAWPRAFHAGHPQTGGLHAAAPPVQDCPTAHSERLPKTHVLDKAVRKPLYIGE